MNVKLNCLNKCRDQHVQFLQTFSGGLNYCINGENAFFFFPSQELYTLRQKTLKQTKEIARLEVQLSQKLKQGQKSLFDQSAKENVLPKPPM